MKKVKPDGSKTIYPSTTPQRAAAPLTTVPMLFGRAGVGGVYEVDKTSGGAVTRTLTYYPVAGAMRINSTLYYTLKDHLGSASVVTDASGNTMGEQRYYPFGETRFTTGSMFTDKLFTGQREMVGLGIYHFNARFYSPKLGRFLSADSIVPGMFNPQNLNRYSYVGNSPLNYIDPSGHMRLAEGPQQDRFKTSVYSAYVPKPKKQSNNSGGGGGEVGGRDGGAPPSPGHVYDNLHSEPNKVCLDLSWINCTDAEVADYMSRWQYPGQLFWNPVQHRGRYNVFPERIGNIPTPIGILWPGSGAIRVEFGDHTISNVARPDHVFYEGYVERTSFRDENGIPYVTTHGEGTNDGFALVTVTINNVETDLIFVPGSTIDEINQKMGPYVFEALDAGLLTYTTIVETGQYVAGLWP